MPPLLFFFIRFPVGLFFFFFHSLFLLLWYGPPASEGRLAFPLLYVIRRFFCFFVLLVAALELVLRFLVFAFLLRGSGVTNEPPSPLGEGSNQNEHVLF